MRDSSRRRRRSLLFPGVLRLIAVLAVASTSLWCGGRPPTAPEPPPDVSTPPAPAPAPEPTSEPPDPSPPVGGQPPSPMPAPIGPPPAGSPVFVGAGDIAPCGVAGPEETARLLDGIPGIVFTLGDHAYPTSNREYFETCYDPTWGRHHSRTRPTLGNHEYESPRAAPYFEYFGANAGPATRGYYSFQIGEWLAIALDSLNGGSDQTAWLRATLAANRSRCTVAYWHHPFTSSGSHGVRPEAREFWRILDEYGADVVLTGHEHFYERFAPQNKDGVRDPQRGMRQFIVGTGGAPLYGFTGVHPNSEVRLSTHGVLKLTLGPTSYAWEFVPVRGGGDFGTDVCH